MRLHIGIDPGLKGGICIMSGSGTIVGLHDMPIRDKAVDVWELTRIINPVNWDTEVQVVCVEALGLRSAQAGVATMGANYGRLMAVLELCYANIVIVQPKAWQEGLDLPRSQKERLQRYTMMAADKWTQQEFFGPRGGMIDGRAAACWIAEYGRLMGGLNV